LRSRAAHRFGAIGLPILAAALLAVGGNAMLR